MALGRPAEALAAFDSAAALFPDPDEALLQAAEWRVVPAALGYPGVPPEDLSQGREALARRASAPGGTRAAWALALDAYGRRDPAELDRWRAVLMRHDSVSGSLDTLAAALAASLAGDAPRALALSAPVLAHDSAGRAFEPFLRAALHLVRGEWFAELGRSADADRSWLWYENTDVVGWPDAEAQAAEVDWALASWARLRRASLAASGGRSAEACARLREALAAWTRPEAPIAALADSLRSVFVPCRA
jgi:hypothetical protein